MENLCKIRQIQRAIIGFETRFVQQYGICLNEGMALCSLYKADKLSSGEIGDLLGLTASNASKVIRSIEEKGLVERILGHTDKRQMYFALTAKGKQIISSIQCDEIPIPEVLDKFLSEEK